MVNLDRFKSLAPLLNIKANLLNILIFKINKFERHFSTLVCLTIPLTLEMTMSLGSLSSSLPGPFSQQAFLQGSQESVPTDKMNGIGRTMWMSL